MRKVISVLCALSLLSGCTSLLKSDQPAPDTYALRAANNIEPLSQKSVSKVIEIQRPILPPGFDTARIGMYLENGRRLDYYAGAKWPAPLDETLQEFTVQTARKTWPSMIMVSPGQSIDTDYRMQIKVNDFQPVYQSGPQAAPLLVASISFTLLEMPSERIVTSFTVDQQEAAQANSLGLITAGLEHLLQSVEAQAFTTMSSHFAGK